MEPLTISFSRVGESISHCPHHKTSTRIPYQISRVSRPGQMCPSWPVALLAQAQLGPVAVASAVDPSCKVHIHDRRGSTLANLQQIRELQGTAGNCRELIGRWPVFKTWYLVTIGNLILSSCSFEIFRALCRCHGCGTSVLTIRPCSV